MSSLQQGGRICHGLEVAAIHLHCFSFLTKVKATDSDEGVNGRVWYRIVKGKSRWLFVHGCICARLWRAARTASVCSPSFCTLQPTKIATPPPSKTSALALIAGGQFVIDGHLDAVVPGLTRTKP